MSVGPLLLQLPARAKEIPAKARIQLLSVSRTRRQVNTRKIRQVHPGPSRSRNLSLSFIDNALIVMLQHLQVPLLGVIDMFYLDIDILRKFANISTHTLSLCPGRKFRANFSTHTHAL